MSGFYEDQTQRMRKAPVSIKAGNGASVEFGCCPMVIDRPDVGGLTEQWQEGPKSEDEMIAEAILSGRLALRN